MSSNSDAAFWRFSHDPNRDPKAERSGKRRRGADGIIRPSPTVFCGLHGLADDAADGLQDLLMGVPEGVRVEHGAGLGRHEQVGTVWVLCVLLHWCCHCGDNNKHPESYPPTRTACHLRFAAHAT